MAIKQKTERASSRATKNATRAQSPTGTTAAKRPAAKSADRATASPAKRATAKSGEPAAAAPAKRAATKSADRATASPAKRATASAPKRATAKSADRATAKSADRATAKSSESAGAEPAKRAPAKRANAKRANAKKSAGPMFEKIAFTMFQVVDPTRARAFYEDVLGLTRGMASNDGAWTEYDLPGGGCLALFCHPDKSARATGGATSVAFEVADLDALNERLQASGVQYQGGIIHGPNCRMSNILDSEGNAIILHELANKSPARAS